jgi:hypothetical protein
MYELTIDKAIVSKDETYTIKEPSLINNQFGYQGYRALKGEYLVTAYIAYKEPLPLPKNPTPPNSGDSGDDRDDSDPLPYKYKFDHEEDKDNIDEDRDYKDIFMAESDLHKCERLAKQLPKWDNICFYGVERMADLSFDLEKNFSITHYKIEGEIVFSEIAVDLDDFIKQHEGEEIYIKGQTPSDYYNDSYPTRLNREGFINAFLGGRTISHDPYGDDDDHELNFYHMNNGYAKLISSSNNFILHTESKHWNFFQYYKYFETTHKSLFPRWFTMPPEFEGRKIAELKEDNKLVFCLYHNQIPNILENDKEFGVTFRFDYYSYHQCDFLLKKENRRTITKAINVRHTFKTEDFEVEIIELEGTKL